MAEPVKEAPKEQPAAPAEPKEKTVGEVIEPKAPEPSKQKEEEPKVETVPLADFLELKKSNKELKKSMKELEKRLGDDPAADVSQDIDAIAEEHNIDKDFLKKLTKSIRSEIEKDTDAKVASKLKPFEEKDRAEKIDAAFKTHFTKAMENLPEYKGIVNAEVIKTLSLNPQNANKTFTQLIEETYGHAVSGKRTIEPTKPGGGKEPTEIDYERAAKDSAYFKEIMANPDLKKKYNTNLEKRLRL